MKYSHEIIIQLPREEVISKMEKPENFKFWQKGFISYKHLSGNQGEEGARSKLAYNMNGREIEMMETIIKSNLPKELHTTYETKGLYNIQKNYFEEESDTSTRWVSYSEFRFSGFMKLIGKLMPGTFKKQSLQFMQDFKAFAEEGKSVK
ncbi:MAG: SRPBCC family protein [Bacteroidota bacterium]